MDSEARAHRVTGQKQSGGLFLGRGLRLCSQWVGNGRASCTQLAYLQHLPPPSKRTSDRMSFLLCPEVTQSPPDWGNCGFGSPRPSCNGAKTVRWTVFRAWTSAVFAIGRERESKLHATCLFTAPSPTKQKDIRLDVLFALLGGEKKVDSEARAHRVTGQKQSGGLFLGRGLRLCSQSAGNGRASCVQLAF